MQAEQQAVIWESGLRPDSSQQAAAAPPAASQQQEQAALPAVPPAAVEQAPVAVQLPPPPPAARQEAPPFKAMQRATSEETGAAAAALPASEALLFSGRCQWVTPKRVLSGQLQVTRTQMYFLADTTCGSTGLAPWLSGPAASGGSGGDPNRPAGDAAAAEEGEGEKPRRRHQRWQLAGLTEVHHSRYLLQPTALECFMADRSSHAFLNFPSHQVG